MRYYKRVGAICAALLLTAAILGTATFFLARSFYLFDPFSIPQTVGAELASFGKNFSFFEKPMMVYVREWSGFVELQPQPGTDNNEAAREFVYLLDEVYRTATNLTQQQSQEENPFGFDSPFGYNPGGWWEDEEDTPPPEPEMPEYDLHLNSQKNGDIFSCQFYPKSSRLQINSTEFELPQELNARLLQYIKETYPIRVAEE